MTEPRSGSADAKNDKTEGKSAAVRVQADAASEQDTTITPAESVEVETTKPDDTENPGSKDTDNANGRLKRSWKRGRKSGPADEGSPEGEGAKQASDSTDVAVAEDDAESDAAASDDAEVDAAASDDAEAEETVDDSEPAKGTRRISWSRVLVYGGLPGLALLLAIAVGVLKWVDSSERQSQLARIESVAAAKDSTIALLSYKSETVQKDLDAAKGRMTGAFKESYSRLISEVVIPGAKKDHISTTATVPAAASVSATPNHAVTLLFVNQTATVDKNQPTDSTSSVRVTLDKIGDRWLISGFDPV